LAIETIPGASASDLTTLLGTAGADSIETSATEVKDLFIDALQGNDNITATAGLTNVRVEGDEGNDTITFEGFVFGSDRRIQGGQDDDTITFQGDVENLTVRGGKDADSIQFQADLEGSVVQGDKGADTINFDGEVLTTSAFGGDRNDTITFA
jgi:Ca2+-binding RTX toxin-like protein